MKKRKLLDWMEDYLKLNGTISLEAVNLLYGPTTYGGYSGRISEMRSRGMIIGEGKNGVHKLSGYAPRVRAPLDTYIADLMEETAEETYGERRINDLMMEVNGIKQELSALELRLRPLMLLLKDNF